MKGIPFGCPSLLWELRRAHREELTATQLSKRNSTERIVDKDNHLRDSLKYLVLTLPVKPEVGTDAGRRSREAFSRAGDLTSALIRYQQKIQELQRSSQPENLSRYRRRR
jgi:hypothetical protein